MSLVCFFNIHPPSFCCQFVCYDCYKLVLRFVSFRFSYLTSKMFYVVVETYTPVLEGEIGAMVVTRNL